MKCTVQNESHTTTIHIIIVIFVKQITYGCLMSHGSLILDLLFYRLNIHDEGTQKYIF